MRFGIPTYRLPRDVLRGGDRRAFVELGVRLSCDSKVTDIRRAMSDGDFDAAFLAVGAQIGKRAYIPAGEAAHILDAVSLLRGMEGGEQPMLGRRVAVYGGGEHGDGCGEDRQATRRHRRDRRLPAHARADARP